MIKKLLPYIAGAVIGATVYFTGQVTDFNEALAIAFDQEKAKQYCEQILTKE